MKIKKSKLELLKELLNGVNPNDNKFHSKSISKDFQIGDFPSLWEIEDVKDYYYENNSRKIIQINGDEIKYRPFVVKRAIQSLSD